MGAPKGTSYRDDPDAVSLHTTPGDSYDDNDGGDGGDNASSSFPSMPNSAPPVYTPTSNAQTDADPNDPAYAFRSLGTSAPECHITYQSKRIFAKRTRIANEVASLQDARADTDPAFLQRWIEAMAREAPAPYIHIIGNHKETRRGSDGKKTTENVTDFRILVSMRNYLWPGFKSYSPNDMDLRTVDNGEKTWRGGVFKARAPGAKGDIEVGEEKATLKEWCHRYCASPAGTRIFRLTRTITGLDETHLRTRIEGLIRSTNYKGHISIEFPVSDRAVDIYTSSKLNTWRLTTWICWLFYLSFLWLFSWPILYFTTKRYHVVRAEWPFSQLDAQGRKRYTTVSEEQWVDKFGLAVRQLCMDRYEGMAGDDLLTQVLARPETHQPLGPQFRAQAAVGAAVGAVRGGFNAVNQVNNLMRFAGGSSGDQIGWGFDT
ncbi:hypothetical protein EJ05DRAFT_535904 [Pseudovirgaria hyperparasitica]|uniref:Uncharacterized protein n=1 Tax=Pseudovirgaria hyperparasitica TaxID=470096 RepID=A0A6A6WGF8_9PEZI|nr:uncharacterized protein EJ05DRAFT_535904 [Pseudovirgaria hyperparasitica]KAF2761046.1 hypothetical protein EJ05DRAFT_535904 [Pseudovirgaria hyperparasitica]